MGVCLCVFVLIFVTFGGPEPSKGGRLVGPHNSWGEDRVVVRDPVVKVVGSMRV